MEMSLSKLQAIVKDREDWCDSCVSVGLHRVGHSLMTEEQQQMWAKWIKYTIW